MSGQDPFAYDLTTPIGRNWNKFGMRIEKFLSGKKGIMNTGKGKRHHQHIHRTNEQQVDGGNEHTGRLSKWPKPIRAAAEAREQFM